MVWVVASHTGDEYLRAELLLESFILHIVTTTSTPGISVQTQICWREF